MMLTMAYLLLIASLIGLAAHFGERICAELGWTRRGPWLAALAASIALPAFALFYNAPSATSTPILSLPLLLDAPPVIDGGVGTAAGGQAAGSSFNWPDWRAFDAGLAMLWIASSAVLLLVYSLAGLRLNRITAKAPRLAVADDTVLLSDRLGPAVLGFFRPRIVLPRWLAEEDSGLRAQVLNHERQHIAARDQLALLAALLLVAVMPWNVALWWQLRRLRLGMEVDCDSRVLGAGADPGDYSRALLTVGQRALRPPFAAVALTEPVSELERRIRIMLERTRNFSLAGFGTRVAGLVAMLGLAVAVNAPNAQQAADDAGAASAQRSVPTLRFAVAEQFSAAQSCMEQGDIECVIGILDEIGETEDLNSYESAQLQNFYAFTFFEQDNIDGAIGAYERILALPQDELPAGLVSASMRNLATLYLQADRLQEGLDLYDRWLDLPYVDASGPNLFLQATILYQLERYPEAIAATEQAIASADEPQEAWYELLYVLQSETGDEAGMARTLETLNTRWRDEQRAAGAVPGEPGLRGLSMGVSDGEYLPIVRVAPVYPARAAARGLEGYVIVRYTVTATGETRDVEVVESTSTLFERAAVEAAQKFLYRPRIIDGEAVEVPGVTSRITFELPEDD